MMPRRRKSPEQALEEARAAIRRDRAEVKDSNTGKALAYIEEHVFDPELTAAKVGSVCGIGRTALALCFRQELRTTVRQLLSDN